MGSVERARDHDWFGFPSVTARTRIEGYARDSFENLVFSLAVFRDEIGVLPEKVIVVGWTFKRERFEIHAAALQWRGNFEYWPVNNPPPDALASARAGEAKKLLETRADPCLRTKRWRDQRRLRNPFGLRTPYDLGDLVEDVHDEP